MNDRSCRTCAHHARQVCPSCTGPYSFPHWEPAFRRFRVECECDGAPFVWEGQARNEQAAIRSAAYDLAVKRPNVDAERVQATSCVEVAS